MAESLNAQFANQKLSLDGISIRFDLPPDMVVLSDSGKLVRLPLWVVPAPLGPDVNFIRWDIRTQSSDTRGSTTVTLELMQSALKISIKPALIIEPLAASAYGLSSITYTFKAHLTSDSIRWYLPSRAPAMSFNQPQPRSPFDRVGLQGSRDGSADRLQCTEQPPLVAFPQFTGDITDVELGVTHWYNNPIRPTETIKNNIRDSFLQFIRGTRYARPNYTPLADPDPVGGLQEIRANMVSMPGTATVNAGLSHLNALGGDIEVTIREPITLKAAGGGIEIPSGTRITIDINLLGNAQDVMGGQIGMAYAVLRTDDKLFVTNGNDRVAVLKSVTLHRCGSVTVFDPQALGSLAIAKGVEDLVRFREDPLGRHRNVFADEELQQRLERAVRQFYVQNFDTLQKAVYPVSLPTFFGMDRNGRSVDAN